MSARLLLGTVCVSVFFADNERPPRSLGPSWSPPSRLASRRLGLALDVEH